MTDAPAIKQNANGVWMLEGEQLWDSDILPVCLEHIKEGDTVIDAGAWIGGHTMTYAEKVGENGLVIAFEPNPYADECLRKNCILTKGRVFCEGKALGDKDCIVSLSVKKGWYDSGYVGEDGEIVSIRMVPLDDYYDEFQISPNFIKIDVEGCELKVLKGAAKTIEKHRPTMVIEINKPALERQGDHSRDIFNWLSDNRYALNPIEAYTNQDVYNILAIPR